MSKTLLSTDMISIGLLLSKGDIDMKLEELFVNESDFQEREFNHPKGCDTNFQDAIRSLVYFESDLGNINDDNQFLQLPFRKIIPLLLSFQEVWMNDEGEHWVKPFQPNEYSKYFSWEEVNPREKFEAKELLNAAMKEFFKNCNEATISIEDVNWFIEQHQIRMEELMYCFHGGKIRLHNDRANTAIYLS